MRVGSKVEEYATNVGLGWVLNWGGSISRQVRGLPDETPDGFITSGGSYTLRYINGPMTPQERQNYQLTYRQGQVDGAPDIFYYNVGGVSGKFFLPMGRSISLRCPGLTLKSNEQRSVDPGPLF